MKKISFNWNYPLISSHNFGRNFSLNTDSFVKIFSSFSVYRINVQQCLQNLPAQTPYVHSSHHFSNFSHIWLKTFLFHLHYFHPFINHLGHHYAEHIVIFFSFLLRIHFHRKYFDIIHRHMPMYRVCYGGNMNNIFSSNVIVYRRSL